MHSKNNFSLAILTGDVFAEETSDEVLDALVNGTFQFPLPTYFTVGKHALPDRIAAKIEADEDIGANLHFLGKRSINKTAEGLRIVALGGFLDQTSSAGKSQEQYLPFHTEDDAKSLKGANTADILLTSMWPRNIWSGSKVTLEAENQNVVASSSTVAELCDMLKPRYHLSASPAPFFYEREPFSNSPSGNGADRFVTRFISMAPFGNASKAKALYAFTLNKADDALPPGTTQSPFVRKERKRGRPDDSFSRFGPEHRDHRHRDKRKRQRSPPPGPDQCFFCLSNPNLSAHMCCTIGDDAYITTAKGPLSTATTFAEYGLKFPGHFIIIPLPHAPTLAAIGDIAASESEAARTLKEMVRFRQALQHMISVRSARRLGAVTWEISRGRNVHLIWQTMAVPAKMIEEGLAEAAFKVEADNLKYPKFSTLDLPPEERAVSGDFFHVQLWVADSSGMETNKSIFMPLEPDTRFDLQFARRVLAKLLGLESRLSWQDCVQTEEEETQDVAAVRDAFKEWDFTAE